jgi:hypothetical protein
MIQGYGTRLAHRGKGRPLRPGAYPFRLTSDSTAPLGVWLAARVEGSCRDTAASSRSSLAQGELKGKLELLVCVRCCGQRPNHSRIFWRARHVQHTARQPGQSKVQRPPRSPPPGMRREAASPGPTGRDGLRTGQVSWCSHRTPWHRPPHRPGVLPGGTRGQVCPAGRAGVRCGAGVQGCSDSLCGNPEFANRVPTSTPRAWRAHAGRPHCLLPSMPFFGLAPHRPEFSHSPAS